MNIRRISAWQVLFILASLYFVFLIRSDWITMSELSAQKKGLTGEISDGKGRQTELKARVKSLEDPSYIELVARQKLGMVKRSETAYKVIRE
jgi:cell division protein FtsB